MLKVLQFKTEIVRGVPVDMVEISNTRLVQENGSYASSTWHRVDRIRPGEDPKTPEKDAMFQARWNVVGPAYEAWKIGQAVPETGTPLGAWHGVSTEQADAIRRSGITTVEALAEMSEDMLRRPALPGMRQLREAARKWIAGKADMERDREMEAMKAQLEVAMEMLAEARAKDPADAEGEPEAPKRRGRPPKAQVEADEAA